MCCLGSTPVLYTNMPPPYLGGREEAHQYLATSLSPPLSLTLAPSPRGDLEILAYCLLQWSAGSLPWEQCLDKDRVAQMKIRYARKITIGSVLYDTIIVDITLPGCVLPSFYCIFSIINKYTCIFS